MKKPLLIMALLATTSIFAQEPVVQNADLLKIERDGESDCVCAGWTNKDLGDQLESSSWNSNSKVGAKFDELEADAMYQEVAVTPNTTYKFTYYYNFEEKEAEEPASSLEVRILAGTGYVADYTPQYPDAFDWQSSNWGYRDIENVEDAANNLASDEIAAPDNKDFVLGELTFNSGDNNSIVLFLRGIGRPNTRPVDKTDNYTWSNGGHEIRIEYVTLKTDATASVEDFSNYFRMYPNPVNDILTIQSQNIEVSKVEIYNTIGQRVLEQDGLEKNTINVSSLNKGIYVLKLSNDAKTYSTKIVVE